MDNSARGRDGSGGKSGQLWCSDGADDNSRDNSSSSLLMRANVPGTVLSI